MLSVYLLFLLIVLVKSLKPSCQTCKFFIPNKINNDNLGQCARFQDIIYDDKQQVRLQKNLAIYCRNDENLCGKSGYLYEPIEKHKYAKKFKNYHYINKLCGDDFVEETKLEELERIERDLIEVFKKMRRHNLKVIYNTPKTISKLFKNLKE
jgi:hypothetical protein